MVAAEHKERNNNDKISTGAEIIWNYYYILPILVTDIFVEEWKFAGNYSWENTVTKSG